MNTESELNEQPEYTNNEHVNADQPDYVNTETEQPEYINTEEQTKKEIHSESYEPMQSYVNLAPTGPVEEQAEYCEAEYCEAEENLPDYMNISAPLSKTPRLPPRKT